jgi:aminopeptidase
VKEHAKWLVNYCTSVKPVDNVLVSLGGSGTAGDAEGLELATEIFKEVARIGSKPLLVAFTGDMLRGYIESAPADSLAITPRNYLELVKACDVIIWIIAERDTEYLKGVDSSKIAKFLLSQSAIREDRLKKRWVATLHPTAGHAIAADMSLAKYRDFVYSTMLRDWQREVKPMVRLKETMERTNEVRLIGKDTDISFSIRDRKAIVDDAKLNFPGGEVFTSPVDDSAIGKVYFDLPSVEEGQEVKGIRLTFDKGQIVDYSATKNQAFLKHMIETDEGSKRLGEFGVGCNRGVNRFTHNILFDEKMAGTIHLAIGNAFEFCGGVNKSALHWDMIKTMIHGEILMDGETIQKNGKFAWE